jgi:quercetin dioxygenase-like cupin family protein
MFLVVGLGCLAVPTSLLAQESFDHPVVKLAATAQLASVANVPECITAVANRGNPDNGPTFFFTRTTPGCIAPWHWHTPNEQVMMVSGIFRMEMQGEKPVLLRRGDFAIMPAHHVGRFTCISSVPCVSFVYSDGAFDIHYVDKSGKEISPGEALKAARPAKGNSEKQ